MNGPTHTPGPWIDSVTLEWLIEPKHLLANSADARLIAAAPELLEALEAICKTMDGYRSQAKFCDVEALSYFREFDRRIEASGFRAALARAKARGAV